MLEAVTRNWWTLLLRGGTAVLFGVLLFALPTLTLASTIIFFGAYALVDGVFNTVGALFSVGKYEGWWVSLLGGLVSIVAGTAVMTWPGLTALSVLWLIALWAVATGILQIFAAFQLRRDIDGEWFMGLGGALSVLFGVLLVVWPSTGIVTLLGLVGIYAVVFGVVMVVLSFRVRGAHKAVQGFKSDVRSARG